MMQVNFGNAMAFSYIESRLKIVVIQENLLYVFLNITISNFNMLRQKIKLYIFSNLNLQVQNMSMNVVR